jgi:RHS repeat-associated protein
MAETGAGSVSYQYDLLGHLTQVTRISGESESLSYGPGGELIARQIGERFAFYVGEYATVTAWGTPGCGAACAPQAGTVEVDAHVVFAGTRIASVKPSRTLYYYRTRLGTVVATGLGGGVPGAGYRYTPYGEVELTVNETEATRSELGYTNALRLTGSLLHLKNRVYDAEGRVFLQADTVDRLRYAYVTGDPVNLSDPTGLEADVSVPPGPVQDQAWSVRILTPVPVMIPDPSVVPNEAPVSGESVAQQVNGIAMQFEKLKTDIGAALPGTGAGEYALKFYIGVIGDPNAGAAAKGAAYVGGFFSALWTKETAVETAVTLGTAAIANESVKAAATATEAGAEGCQRTAGSGPAGSRGPHATRDEGKRERRNVPASARVECRGEEGPGHRLHRPWEAGSPQSASASD